MIPKTILDRFKELYKLDYKIELSDAEALEKCTALFTALETIVTPLTPVQLGGNNGIR